MLMKIVVVLAVIVLGFVGVVATRPSEYRVARTVTMAAPASAVFAQVNDFRSWDAWNPWAHIDPAMKQSYDGPAAGPGAVYAWAGNTEVGEGLKPFAATSTAEFTFRPEGDRTAVTWSMVGKANFVAKAVHLFVDMDTMIGTNFEKGLTDMKAVVEATRSQR